jgi:hypothetical protein
MPVSGYLEAGKTDAVTLAGGVLLFLATLLALFLLIPAVHLAVGPATPANILSIFGLLISALVFGVVGIAVARRWPHWRVYAGVLSWVLIVFGTLSVVSLVSRLDFGGTLVALILIAIGAFPLWAKRHEPKEGVAPPVTSDDAKQRSRPVDISRFIDEREISSFNVRLVLLLFFLFLLEQFELRVPGYALSELAKTLPRSDLPRVFSATLLGVAVGAPVFGYLGDRAGRKTMTVACCLLLGMLTFLTPWMAANLEHLLLARFITGLGLGGVLPNIIALTGEFTPGRLRAGVITSIFALALLVGSILPNLIMVDLIPAYGWGIAFHAGGILALVMAMVVLLWIPESIQFLVLKSRRPIAVARSLTRLGVSIPRQSRGL